MKKVILLILLIINSSILTPSQSSHIIKAIIVIGFRALNTDNNKQNYQMHIQSTYQVQSAIKTNKKTISTTKIMTPQQAHQSIEQNVIKIFDPHDTHSLLEHFEQIENNSKYLDPIKNKKQIEAINFISKNKDKSNMMDIPFWYDAWYETGILKGLPIPQKIKDTPYPEMLPQLIQLSKKL